MRLESFAVRDRIRFACNLGLVYDTTREQMQSVLTGIEELLCSHPKIWPDAVVVRLKELGESALIIEVQAWFQTADFAEFQGIRQGVLLSIMDVVEASKTRLAFPTRTVHLVRDR
jgi:MscS family membrane protein